MSGGEEIYGQEDPAEDPTAQITAEEDPCSVELSIPGLSAAVGDAAPMEADEEYDPAGEDDAPPAQAYQPAAQAYDPAPVQAFEEAPAPASQKPYDLESEPQEPSTESETPYDPAAEPLEPSEASEETDQPTSEPPASAEEQQGRVSRKAEMLEWLKAELPGVPSPYREELGEDVLQSVADCASEGSGVEIVRGLVEVERLRLRELADSRAQIVAEQERRRASLGRESEAVFQSGTYNGAEVEPGARGPGPSDPQRDAFERKCRQELRRWDMKTVMELDQLVSKQQHTLEKAGLPLFRLTNAPDDVSAQTHVIRLLLGLADRFPAAAD